MISFSTKEEELAQHIAQSLSIGHDTNVFDGLGRCDPLGADLIRLIIGMETRSFQPAIQKATVKLNLRYDKKNKIFNRVIGESMVRSNVLEFIADQCPECEGRAWKISDESSVSVPCVYCNETGRKEWTAIKRAEYSEISLEKYRANHHQYNAGLRMLNTTFHASMRKMWYLLY